MIHLRHFSLLCAVLGFSSASALHAQFSPLRNPPVVSPATWDEKMDGAMHALKSNRLDEAIALCEQATVMARAFGPHDTRLSRSLVLRAEICMWEKKNDRAEELFQEAVASCEHAVGSKHRELVHPLSSQANFYYYVSPHYEKVAALFERILDIVDHASPRDDREVLMWSRNLGMVYQKMGDSARGEPLFGRAVALAEKADPTGLPYELLSAAQFYRIWQKFDRAEELAQRALGLRERALAATPDDIDAKLDVAVALDELGAIYLAAQKLETAEAVCRRSLKIVDSFMTANQPDLRPRLAGLGAVLCARHKFDEAAGMYQRLLAITEQNMGPDSVDVATVLSSYATVLRGQQKASEATTLETRAETIRKHATAAL